MLIRRNPSTVLACGLVMLALPFSLRRLHEAGGHAESVKGPGRIRDLRDHLPRPVFAPSVQQRPQGSDHGRALILGVGRWTVTPLATHACLEAERAAPAA